MIIQFNFLKYVYFFPEHGADCRSFAFCLCVTSCSFRPSCQILYTRAEEKLPPPTSHPNPIHCTHVPLSGSELLILNFPYHHRNPFLPNQIQRKRFFITFSLSISQPLDVFGIATEKDNGTRTCARYKWPSSLWPFCTLA